MDVALKRQEYRQENINLGAFLDSLGIVKGMTILDIGAGPGYVDFLLAEKLQGSGAVLATDVRGDFVDHINEEAKTRGLSNLTAVLVCEDGVDDFYAKQRYDLVLLSNAYHCLEDRVAYFTKVRGYMKPDARLVVILYNQTPLFSTDDFDHFDGLVTRLSEEADDGPFMKNLSVATRKLLREDRDSPALESALVEDFNRMLVDPGFYRNFYRGSFFVKDLFTPPERDFANWLLMTVEEDGAFYGALDRTDERKMRTVIKLNRLFFMKRFGDFLAQGGRGAYLPIGDNNRHTSKFVMLGELDVAGYRVVKETKLSPTYDAVILVPKVPQVP